jgi:hypothetical protein
MLLQLRSLAKCICNSPMLHVDLPSTCNKCKIKPLLMVCDVATRWNCTAGLLERALQLCEALNQLVVSEHHNRPRSAHLRRFQLSKNEWELLDRLFPLLEVHTGTFPDTPWSDVFVGISDCNKEDVSKQDTACP